MGYFIILFMFDLALTTVTVASRHPTSGCEHIGVFRNKVTILAAHRSVTCVTTYGFAANCSPLRYLIKKSSGDPAADAVVTSVVMDLESRMAVVLPDRLTTFFDG